MRGSQKCESLINFFAKCVQSASKSSTATKYAVLGIFRKRRIYDISNGGAYGIRTRDPHTASVVRSQLR